MVGINERLQGQEAQIREMLPPEVDFQTYKRSLVRFRLEEYWANKTRVLQASYGGGAGADRRQQTTMNFFARFNFTKGRNRNHKGSVLDPYHVAAWLDPGTKKNRDKIT